MRAERGRWLLGSGIAITALAGFPYALGTFVLTWVVFALGLAMALVGAAFVILGADKHERRESEHARKVEQNRLENERGALEARRATIGGDLSTKRHWLAVAVNYKDDPRRRVLEGEIAELEAECGTIERRLAEIDTELRSA